jgi:hypothetical protein
MQHVSLLTAEDLTPIQADIQIIKKHLLAGMRLADDYLDVAQVAALTATSERTVRAFEERYGKPTEPSAILGNHIWAGEKVVLSIREAMTGNEEAQVLYSTLDYARVHLGSVK